MGVERPHTEGRGMLRSALPIALVTAALAAAPSTASALDEQGYWAFADRMQTGIDRYWDDRGGWYPGMGSGAHADVLLTYAVDRKSTRLNSSHANISYAVFCLKKKKKH